jgi:hypothetical protein
MRLLLLLLLLPCSLSGKVVSAGAKPVADAAKALKWEGDAAFELLGMLALLVGLRQS